MDHSQVDSTTHGVIGRSSSYQKKNIEQKKCKSAYNTHLSDMVQEDGNSKKLYSFIKSKKCNSAWISPLGSDGNLHGELSHSPYNQQFSSVFTTEELSKTPDLGINTIPSASDIRVTEKGVLKFLSNVNLNKATGQPPR